MEIVQEKRLRSLVKATTFRIIIVIADTAVVYLITRNITVTIWVLVIRNIVSTVLYFGHERIWERIRWGRAFLVPNASQKALPSDQTLGR